MTSYRLSMPVIRAFFVSVTFLVVSLSPTNSDAQGIGGWNPNLNCSGCWMSEPYEGWLWKNAGMQLSVDALKTLAVSSCQNAQASFDTCEVGAGPAIGGCDWDYDISEYSTYFNVQVCLYRDSSHLYSVEFRAIWQKTNTDSDCPVSDVIDRVTHHDCVKPNTLFTVEPPPPPKICTETNPCNPANGNKSQKEADYASGATGTLSFSRYYNSKGAYKTGSAMPAGWRHTYSRVLDEEPDRRPTVLFAAPTDQSSFYYSASDACALGWDDLKASVWSGDLATATSTFSGGNTCKISSGGSTVAYMSIRSGGAWSSFTPPSTIKTITRANGTSHKFEQSGSDWVNVLNPALTLEQSGSNWIFTDSNDTQETFDASGKLMSITYRNGRTETLEYGLTTAQGGDDDATTLDKVTGTFGHVISFAYNASGRLVSVTTADGTITYGFDSVDNLSSVTYPDTSVRQYVYEDTTLPNHLTGIIDENSDRFATWAYDSAGRAILSEHAGGKEQVQLAYNANGTTTLTTANGASRIYTFTTEQGRQVLSGLVGDVCSQCPGGNTKDRTYDANGFLDEATDWDGNITKTARNSRGLTETLTEAKGSTEQRITSTTWHATYRLPTQIVSPKNTTVFGYDTDGNLLTATTSSVGLSRTWTMTYNANGQPLTINGPRTSVTDLTTLAYYTCTTGNECGQLHTVTNALSQVTTYNSYDTAGRPTLMTDANGLQTSFSYDVRGNLVTVVQTPTIGTARTTTMSYDNVGQLTTHTLPNGVVLTYAYDAAHYRTSVTDNLGNKIDYGYDAMGNLIDEDTSDSASTLKRAVDYAYDLNNRLDTVTSGGFITDLTIDSVGNVTGELDPGLANTQHSYDALNRLEQTIDALSGIISYGYDDHNNIASVNSANGATTTYEYDALDNLTKEISPDRDTITYTYDDAGNRISMIDARSVTTTYAYDALNRLTSISYPNTVENVTYGYDVAASNGIGRLTSISDQSGTTTYTYDEFGIIATDVRVVSSVTYTTSYQYDDDGNISSITYPSGRVIDYVRDTTGQITQATSVKNSVSKTLVSSVGYDPFGPVTDLTYGNSVVFDYQYGLDNRITSITSSGIAGKQYSYDAAGNIDSIGDNVNAGLAQDFGYDTLGRLTAETPRSEYADRVLADNPIAYWRLGEASGTTAADASGNGRDATYSGTVVLGKPALVGNTDTAMGIDVVGSGYVDGPTLTGITATGIEAWFKTTAAGSYRTIISLHNSNSDRVILAHDANGTVGIYKNTSGYLLVSDAVVSINQTHHIAVWYESNTNKTYMMIDGVTQQNIYTGNLLTVYNPKVYIAAYRSSSTIYKNFPGVLDEIAVYDSSVTASTFANRTTPLSPATSASIDFGYDANGNRTSLDDGVTLNTYSYQTLSNTLVSIDSVSITHDLAGNRTADLGGTRTFSYNNANRLAEVFNNGNSIATYVQNALGQRTKKSANSANTVYVYDIFGHLIAEHSDTGTLIRDYVWLNNTPVAQIDQGEVFSYLHFDHLNTPRLATNDSQSIVWRWDSDAFGSTLPDEDPDADSNATTVNLRFPGQYYDQETGLHYNYYRTLDPSTGRYLESDPIGLEGGLNTYGYVSQSPTNLIDPSGLIEWNGKVEIVAAGPGVGVARVVFDLESECVGGKRIKIKDLVIWAFNTDIGVPAGAVRGTVSLEDGKSSLNPDNLSYRNLEGDFSALSIGPTILGIGFPTAINLGDARGLLRAESGLDFTVISQATAGNVRIKGENLAYEECECKE